MGDSFSDLWSSSAPAANQQNKSMGSLGSAAKSTTVSPQAAYANKRTTPDVFSMLASSGSPSTSRPITPQSQPQRQSPKPPVSSNGDAFSSLLGTSSLGSSANMNNMTMAQRAAHVAKQQSSASGQTFASTNPAPTSSAWDGLDSLGGAFGSASSAPPPSGNDDLFDFVSAPTRTTSSSSQAAKPASASADNDDWGLSDFASAPPTTVSSSSKKADEAKPSSNGGNIWDIDDFATSHSSSSKQKGSQEDADSDDEWGVKRGVGASNYDDDDDILGDLSKPVDHDAIKRRKAEAEAQERAKREREQARSSSRSSSSPPPHVLGTLVSMGFSVPEAKAALAKANGNPEAAVEILVNAGGSGSRPGSREDGPPPPALPHRPSAQRQTSSSRVSPSPGGNEGINTDKLVAQATEIGTSLFNRAGAMWRQGKEQVQKAYEERKAVAGGSGSSTPAADGRPKWMREAAEFRDEHEEPGAERRAGGGGFKDEEGMGPKPVDHPSSRPQRQQPKSKAAEPQVDLFNSSSSSVDARRFVSKEDEEVKAYVSPFRRKGGASRTATPSAAPTLPQRPAQPPAPQRRPHPSTQIAISPSQTSSVKQHVVRAENAVKLGQYPVAVDAYTAAINEVPDGHAKSLSLFLGRGEARMRDGDSKGGLEDAQRILAILIPSGSSSFNPQDWTKVDGPDELGKVYVGALKMRAQGNEAKEKWKDAMEDWEKVSGSAFAAGDIRAEANRGRGRCKAMLDPKPKAASSTSAAPAKKPTPIYKPKVQTSGEAVKELRKANQAQENEDDEKFKLKDTVDTKIGAWKNGKETNIRALLGSLDMVLWPELGLKKIGLHELVQEKQVKICYMRAVGRVHPDKINPSNSTLEQRMLANAVFGTLNEAWNSHKG